MMKKISILFFVLLSCLFMSAAELNAYYRVTANKLNARGLPDKTAVKRKQYAKHDVLYITNFSDDRKWGYVYEDDVWVSMSHIQQLNSEELTAYMNYLKRHGITPVSETIALKSRPHGSKPLRIILWVFIGLLLLGQVFALMTDNPGSSIGVYYGTVLLSTGVLVLVSFAQYVLCWGLKIVGWIEHYIFFGWLVDDLANGILAIIPFCMDVPTFGTYGLAVGLLPMIAFYGITALFNDYPFVKWVTYIFQLAMFLAVMVIDTDTWYNLLNPILTLDGVPAISDFAKSCDWGEYANTTFLTAFYIGNITLLLPIALVELILDHF